MDEVLIIIALKCLGTGISHLTIWWNFLILIMVDMKLNKQPKQTKQICKFQTCVRLSKTFYIKGKKKQIKYSQVYLTVFDRKYGTNGVNEIP